MDPDATDTVVGRLTQRARRAALLDSAGREKIRIVLGDALALALAARDTPSGRSALTLASGAPSGAASVVGLARPVTTEAAVLANSVLVHALLRDDAHAETLLHPAAVVLPVALAVAEEVGADGAAVSASIAAGYEVFAGIAEPVATRTAARGFRNTPLFGSIGAAAAAGCLLGLDDARLAAALLIASGSAGGTLQAFRAGSPDWRFQPGLAGQQGLAAARLAAALDPDLLPFPDDALEGPHGLYATVLGPDAGGGAEVSAQPGALLAVSHKAHATCGANQVPVAALSALLASGVRSDDIARIDVHLSRASFEYPGCEDYGPFAQGATFLSRPFALAATALAGGGPLDDAAARAALRDPRLEAMARRVQSHVVDDDLLATSQDAWVDVTLVDGSVRRAGAADVDPLDLAPDWPRIAARLVAAEPVAGAAVAAALEDFPAGALDDLLDPLRTARARSEEP